MLLAAALIPDTALLVPGAGGDATMSDDDPARLLRKAADDAVGDALVGAERVVIVAPGRADRLLEPPTRGSLGAAGVPDEMLWWLAPGPVGAPVPGVSASVALFFAARFVVAHHVASRDARVVEVGPSPDGGVARARALHALGADLVSHPATALVVVGSLSGRHGPDAPLADDERAPGYDDAVLADLGDAGPAARGRLAALDPTLAAALAVTGWGPWQVLLGAVGDVAVTARLHAAQVLAGASHAALTWRAGA